MAHGCSLVDLLDALPGPAAVVTRDGRVEHANAPLAALVGRDPAALLGVALAGLCEGDEAARLAALLANFDAGGEGEFVLPRGDGQHAAVLLAARPLPTVNGDPATLAVVTLTDISPQRAAIDQVARLGDTVIERALELREVNAELERRVAARTAELHEANLDAIYMLAVACEARDRDTGEHVRRIERYAERVALGLGLPAPDARRIGYSAILHDVGTLHVRDAVLQKPGPLTPDERAEMQRHTLIGETILSTRPFFEVARQITRHHHENFDGSGYPDALAGDAIPLPARVVHLVDVFDALSSPRVYKDAWPIERAAATVAQGAGTQFDPAVVQVFVRLFEAGEMVGD